MKHNENLIYDVDGLVAEAKKNLRNSIVKISIVAVVLTLSILAIVFFGSYMLVFIGGIVLACVSVFMFYKWVKQISFADYSSASGEIAGDKWLCPVCGEFNANEEKICNRCKKKIIK